MAPTVPGAFIAQHKDDENLQALVESFVMEVAQRELHIWGELWGQPQAIMWEQMRLEVEVALYVRSLVEAERSGSQVNVRTLVKQHQENLGLSVAGLARNRWRIAPAEIVPDAQVERRPSAKDRLKIVPPTEETGS